MPSRTAQFRPMAGRFAAPHANIAGIRTPRRRTEAIENSAQEPESEVEPLEADHR